jgi:putative DNA primase/helicase
MADGNITPFPPKAGRKKPPPSAPPAAGSPTEQTVMRMFTDRNRDEYRYNHDSKTWFVWREHRWREDGKQRVFAAILDLCRALGQGATINKIRFARAVEEGCRVQREFATISTEWDADPWLLGTPGGVVELQTGKLRDGKPEDMVSKICAVTPAAKAHCPKWLKFINEALDGKVDNISFFQRFCGYSLTGLTREEMLLFVAGKPGTGKGTATKTILSIMRDYALTVPVTMFTDTGWRALEYYRAKLPGRRIILASEPEKGATWSDAFVNELTGSDMLSARHPAGKPFDFDPTHKLVIHGEQVPELKSVSTGLKRRLGIMPFNHSPEAPDPNLKEALKAERPGILRWLIDGCLEWQRIGLAPPPDVRNAVDEYFARQDAFARWMAECCDQFGSFRTQPKDLLASYNNWADRSFEKRLSYNGLHEALAKRNFDTHPIAGTNYVHGIAVKPPKRANDYNDPDDPLREF